jgi:hypothetical protein
VESCSHCGGPLPVDATFCPSCGRRTDAPPAASREVPIDVQHAEPRYFGLGTPVFIFAAAAALLLLGIVLIATGRLALGAVAVVLALCLVPAFLAGARRWPETRIAQMGVGTADRVRGEAGAAVESVSTWSRASRDVVRIRKEQFQLRRERDAKVRELGVSFYSDDGRADELKAAAKALDERIAANDLRLQRTVAGARRRTRKERAAVVATEVIAPEPEADAPAAAPAEDEPLTRAESDGAAPPKPKPAAKKRQARSR